MKKFSELSKKKKCVIISGILLILTAVIILLIMLFYKGTNLFNPAPSVTIQTPDKKSQSDKEPFTLDLQLSGLRNDIYPAASFSISFDSSHLEFLGIDEGNVMILGGKGTSKYQLPKWNVNVEHSNDIGQINIMYLDQLGGKNAFSKETLLPKDNVLLKLNFKIRGTARSGEVYELNFDDAVFAASDESKSLASSKKTLKTNNGRIVIGD